jgi:hypothetical protein
MSLVASPTNVQMQIPGSKVCPFCANMQRLSLDPADVLADAKLVLLCFIAGPAWCADADVCDPVFGRLNLTFEGPLFGNAARAC